MARVLIVDDEVAIRRLLRGIIERAGHEVDEAAIGEDAVAHLQNTAVDVVFADIEMPGRGGRWMTLEIRKRHPRTAVILATGVTDVEAGISLKYGVLAYLLKPFDRRAVETALARALDWQATADEGTGERVGELERWLAAIEP